MTDQQLQQELSLERRQRQLVESRLVETQRQLADARRTIRALELNAVVHQYLTPDSYSDIMSGSYDGMLGKIQG